MVTMADRPEVAELTECSNCGRATRTVGPGACAECWEAKIPGGRSVISDPGPRTESLFGMNLDVFDLLPNWMWLFFAGGLVSAVAFAVWAFIG
jgi:hypothetical protein